MFSCMADPQAVKLSVQAKANRAEMIFFILNLNLLYNGAIAD